MYENTPDFVAIRGIDRKEQTLALTLRESKNESMPTVSETSLVSMNFV